MHILCSAGIAQAGPMCLCAYSVNSALPFHSYNFVHFDKQGIHADFEFVIEELYNTTDPIPFAISISGGADTATVEGAITVNGSLDFETTQSYIFRVSDEMVWYINLPVE